MRFYNFEPPDTDAVPVSLLTPYPQALEILLITWSRKWYHFLDHVTILFMLPQTLETIIIDVIIS